MNSETKEHIVPNGEREWIGTLEDHSDLLPYLNQFDVGAEDVVAENADLSRGADISESLHDAVDAPKKRGFSAAGGADHARDHALANLQIHVEKRLEIAVPEVQVLGFDGV